MCGELGVGGGLVVTVDGWGLWWVVMGLTHTLVSLALLVVLLCRELEREAEVEKAKEGIVTCVQR